MSGAGSITRQHQERLAVVYVRQSSPGQVRKNPESTARQYALVEEAVRLGWDARKVLTIDSDQAMSGRTASQRSGFQELISRVCLGEVGVILGLEVSRLARSSADLQRLMEFCSLTDTLIIDADGVYDLQNFNDRLLLGLKGTMSEAELHILAGRLQESKLAAARRGELRRALPVGYVYSEDGQTVFDANEEIRAAVADLFTCFEATGSAYGVVASFRERRFPRRNEGDPGIGEMCWGRLTHSRVLGILSNPTYAGTYVHGRFQSRRSVDPDGTIRTRTRKVPREQWTVVLQDHHPAYIDWKTFLSNQERLAANHTHSGSRPPREGTALLQGLVTCGGCGRRMSTVYSAGSPMYDCSHSRFDHNATPACRSVTARWIDTAVAERLLAVVAPEQIRLALAAAEEVTVRRGRSRRALELRVERSRYEAARAERAFHLCEPENRLVARSLETRWEEKLRALAEAEGALAASQASEAPLPRPADLVAMASDLPRLWAAPTTSAKDRKRLLRTLVADVTLISEPGPRVRVGLRWRTGATEELIVFRSGPRQTPTAAIELVRRFADCSDVKILAELTASGLTTGAGKPFDLRAVHWLRYKHHIPRAPKSSVGLGELTIEQVAARLGVSYGVVYYWIAHRQLEARRSEDGRWCIPFPEEVEEASRQRVLRSTRLKPRTQIAPAGGAV